MKDSYIILDWLTGEFQIYVSQDHALEVFNEEKLDALANNYDFDKTCFKVLDEFNTID